MKNLNCLIKKNVKLITKKVNELRSKFRVYAKLYPDFTKTDRYRQITKYLDDLPDVELYKVDSSKGNSINMILEKKHYKEESAKLEAFIKSKTKGAISAPKKR